MMTAVGQSLLRVQSSEMVGHNCLTQILEARGEEKRARSTIAVSVNSISDRGEGPSMAYAGPLVGKG